MKTLLTLLVLFFSSSVVAGNKFSCELTYNSEIESDYKNTWILEIDKKNNYYSVMDTFASMEFTTSNGALTFLGIFDNHYYLIINRSGYLYVYTPENTNSELDKGNHLRVVDPRFNFKSFYFAECKKIL